MFESEIIDQLFTTTSEARFIVDDGGIIRAVSAAGAELLGYGPAELRNTNLNKILSTEVSGHLLSRFFSGSTPENEDIRLDFITKERKHLSKKCVLHSLMDEDQTALLLIHVSIELDELAGRIGELTKRLEFFNEMADIVPAIFWVENKEGTEIEYVNRAYYEVYGVSPQSLIEDNNSWLKWVHPDDLPKVRKIWLESPNSRSEIEFRIIRPDGTIRWVIDTYIPVFDDSGEVIRKVGFGVDVTALKLIQEELKGKESELREQTEELGKLNTALQVLVEHREKEIKDTEANLQSALANLVRPYIKNLFETDLDRGQKVYLKIADSNLDKITAAFARRVAAWQSALTPMELSVADLVLNGRTSLEISELLSISPPTVGFHRQNIRKKLGIENKKINLQSHLRAISAS